MKPMSNVDIFTITDELNNLLTGARVDKSFQPTKDIVVMRFHVAGTGRIDLVMECGKRITPANILLKILLILLFFQCF